MPRKLHTPKNKIIQIYQSRPMTIEELSQLTSVCKPTLIKILDEYDIPRYNKGILYSPSLQENYFKHIDDEFKAYFLGLIITDGCIHNNKRGTNMVCITLQDSDRDILQEFTQCVGSNKKVTSDGRGCYGIQILSNEMCNDLSQHGVIPNKSLQTIFPKNIPVKMYRHLIRGLIDGDGSYSFYSRENQSRHSHTKAIRFCQGNRRFIEDMIDFLSCTVGVSKPSIYQEKENLWSVAYRKDEDMVKLINFMYKDARIYIKRKFYTAQKIYQECSNYILTREGNYVNISNK